MAKKIKYIPNIVRGGTAIPVNNNTFLLKGRKHEQGGIDIGKDVEAEDGELLQINKNNIKILSNAPIMKGKSPAKYALRGTYDGTFKDRFNKSFNYQERYKDRNHLNDDGTKKKGYSKKFNIGGTTNTTLNYIGSNLKNESDKNIDTRLKAIEIGNIAPLIYDVAKKENINPNLLLNRFIREGYLDNQIKEYNEGFKPAILNIKDYPIIDTHLGLDWLAKLYEDKKVNLEGLKFYRNGNKRRGKPKNGGITFSNLESGLTGLAKTLKLYENYDIVKTHPENKETFTNLIYNVGQEGAKEFTDKTAIRRYTIPDYFKYRNLDSRYTKEIEKKEQEELEAQDEQFQKEMQNILNKRIERIKLKTIPLSNVNPVKFNLVNSNSKK